MQSDPDAFYTFSRKRFKWIVYRADFARGMVEYRGVKSVTCNYTTPMRLADFWLYRNAVKFIHQQKQSRGA